MGDTTTTPEVQFLEYKCMGVAGFKVDSAEDGIVTTIVAVTEVRDNVKDIIHAGAFEKSLAVRTPKGVWHHQWSETVSRTESVKELPPGDPELPATLPNGDPWPREAGAVQVKTKFNLETQRGREAYSDVVFFGDQQEWSIGYNVPTGGATLDSKTGIRHIHTLDFYEYSPVLFGAMPIARTQSVKQAQLAYKALQNLPDDEDELEVEVETKDDGTDTETKDTFVVDGVESKAFGTGGPIQMSPAQADRLQKVLIQIMDILRDAHVIEDDPAMADANADPNADPNAEEDVAPDVDIVDLVDQTFNGDEELVGAAEDFESAQEAGDGAAMEEAANTIMDAIEEDVQNGANLDEFRELTDALLTAFNNMADNGDGTDSTDTGDTEPDPNDPNEDTEDPAQEELDASRIPAGGGRGRKSEDDSTDIETKSFDNILRIDDLDDLLS